MQVIIHEGMYILMMICISNISIIHIFLQVKATKKKIQLFKREEAYDHHTSQ